MSPLFQNTLHSACGMPAMAVALGISHRCHGHSRSPCRLEFGKFSSGQPSIGEELARAYLILHMVTRAEFTHLAAIASFLTGRNRQRGLYSKKSHFCCGQDHPGWIDSRR